MIYKDFYPFYTSYANPLIYRGEKEQEEEFFLMKSYYPDTARKIQEKVEAVSYTHLDVYKRQFWKVTADFCGGRKAKLISKTRSHIRFMDDCRNVALACGNYHWYCHEAAFGKYYIRL